MEAGFAESTIVTCMWLIRYQPDDLPAWLATHPPGARLEKIARQRIADNETARAAQP